MPNYFSRSHASDGGTDIMMLFIAKCEDKNRSYYDKLHSLGDCDGFHADTY